MTDDSTLQESTLYPNVRARSVRQVVEPLARSTERVGLGRLAGRLAEVQGWLAADLTLLEAEMATLSAAESDDVARRAAAHLLARPGKRIRPICVLLGAQIAGVAVDAAMRDVAVACELVHAATLLHDDVIDEGTERRGAPAARVVYGNTASILAGDYLLIEALERVSRAGSPALMTSLLDTIAQMVAAEALQLEQRGCLAPSREAYLRVIEGKTASLFRWALSAATLAAGRVEAPELLHLGRAGTALGLAFQLVDDLLDLEGDADSIGKDLHADLLQGKLTWPLIVAGERDPAILALVTALSAGADHAPEIVARLRATDALEVTRAFALHQRDEALDALDALPDGRAARAIRAVVDASVERQG
jgi:octaprenyl-diphosphate synthase